MDKQLFLAIAIILSFGAFATNGNGQGLVEYALTTSTTASATAKAGSSLGKATQPLAGRLQEKLSNATAKPPQTSRAPSRVPSHHPLPAKALKAVPQSASNVASPEKSSAGTKTNRPPKPSTQDEYPSVVDLSFTE
jgi:hypothetical protein